MSNYQSYAEYYHELTKYTPSGIASSQHRLDFDKQPSPFKEYPNKKLIDLSYLLPLDRNPFSDVGIKNPKDFTEVEKSLAKLSTLLYFSNGITAIVPYLDKPFYMRAAPSAGRRSQGSSSTTTTPRSGTACRTRPAASTASRRRSPSSRRRCKAHGPTRDAAGRSGASAACSCRSRCRP